MSNFFIINCLKFFVDKNRCAFVKSVNEDLKLKLGLSLKTAQHDVVKWIQFINKQLSEKRLAILFLIRFMFCVNSIFLVGSNFAAVVKLCTTVLWPIWDGVVKYSSMFNQVLLANMILESGHECWQRKYLRH